MRNGGSLFAGRAPSAPKGHRVYAVGDIHGRLDLLEDMLERIEDDVRNRKRAKTTILFLGDLVDRGPSSREVVERLRTYCPDFARVICLMGNHEEIMLRVLGGEIDLLGDWLKFGGAECLRSYGVDPVRLRRMLPKRALETLQAAVPPEHIAFLRDCADSVSFGSYLFVHAGVRPGVALSEQAQRDLRWIRQPFLDDRRDHGFVVVHGHTIVPEVDEQDNRIGLDTGAYRTGVLTAMAIDGAERWVIQVGMAAAGQMAPRPGSSPSSFQGVSPQ